MSKKKNNSVRAVNKYPHNLNKATIVNDQNSFEVKGVRYLLYEIPNMFKDGVVIDINTGERFVFPVGKFVEYF